MPTNRAVNQAGYAEDKLRRAFDLTAASIDNLRSVIDEAADYSDTRTLIHKAHAAIEKVQAVNTALASAHSAVESVLAMADRANID
jgi:hypothetical protein